MVRISTYSVIVLGLAAGCYAPAQAQTFAHIPALSFTKPFGGPNPLPQTLTVHSTGAAFNYSVAASTTNGGAWLQVVPEGNDCCTMPSVVTVKVAADTSLAAGTYSGHIVLTKYFGGGATLTIPVTLTVAATNTSFFDNLPGQVSFSMATSGLAPPGQLLQIRNGGTGTLNWTEVTSTGDGAKWLTVSSAAGTAPALLSVKITPSALPGGGKVAGTFIGQLLFHSSGSSVSIPVSATVGSSVFAQVNALNFTKTFGGNDPLPQTLAIASTGTDFNISSAAYNGAGGNWLTVSPAGNDCCVTPEAITVSVHPDVGLAAGTYTGEVVINQYFGNVMAMTVPVTLTIEASDTPSYFDNMPGQISFTLKTSGSAPPNQAMQVRNAGSGTLNWTLAATTADGGKWLTVSSASGTAPAMVSVGLDLTKLPNRGQVAGTFVGELVFETAGDMITVPVGVTVGDNVFEQVNGIDFTKQFAGADPLPQTLTIASTGTDFNISVAAYTATGGNWLTVSPAGLDCCVTPESVTVRVQAPPALKAGTYTGQVVISQYFGNGMSMTVPVSLTVLASGTFFDNLPGQMSFFFQTAGNAPPQQTVQIRNGGSGTLNWTATTSTSDGGAWLTTSAVSGTAPSTVTIGVTKASLPGGGQIAGTFTGQLVFQTAGDEVTIPVSVVVGDSVFEQVNPIYFTKPFAGANPLPQTLMIASTGSDFNISVATSTATGGYWLTVSPIGLDCCVTPESLRVSVNPASNLAAGTYTGQVVISQYFGNGMAMTVPVSLTIAAATKPFFDNLPGQVTFSMKTQGTAPPKQPLQLRNGGGGTLNWTVSEITADGGKWLTASAASGSAPSTVLIGVNTALLPNGGQVAGTFTGQLVFQTPGDEVTVPVSVVVGDSVFEQVNPLNFTKPHAGADPLPQTITVASTGTDFNVSAQAFTANGGNWLTVTPAGLDCCVTPLTFTVGVTAPASLAAGTYTGQVVIGQYFGNGMSMTVPVTLTVAPTTTAFFDNVQGQVSFSMPVNSANPPAQPVQIRNGGTGTLNWTVSTSTSDAGKWLSASSLSGTGRATVNISVNHTALPGGGQVAGIFTGQVLLQTAGDAVTIPVSVVVGDAVFQQRGALTFQKALHGPNPKAQTVSIASTGTNFNITVVQNTSAGGSWLHVSPSGADCCVTPRTVTVSVNPSASLAAGTYTGQVVVTQYFGHGIAMTIPVYLQIGAAAGTSMTTSLGSSTEGQEVTLTAKP